MYVVLAMFPVYSGMKEIVVLIFIGLLVIRQALMAFT